MDLKIKDVADLLGISETTVRRWLLDGKIPAYKLNKQYRFSKIEIENWMMQNKIEKTSSDSFFKEEQIYPVKEDAVVRSGMQQFSLYRAIHRGNVYCNVEGKTKKEVIRNTVSLIAEQLKLDAEVLAELLLDREELMPTSLNNGIAVPHARECLNEVPFDLITVVFPKKPIEYGALDGKPVNVLFFLFATGDKMHLHLLSKIAHLSSNQQAVQLFQTRPERGVLLEFIREWEGHLAK